MVGFIIYSAIVLTVGFIGGMMAKHIIDRDAIRAAEVKTRALKRENAYLRKVQKGKVIEIHDDRLDSVKNVDFSKEW